MSYDLRLQYPKKFKKLFDICLDVITPNLENYMDSLNFLPNYVKYRILIRVTKLKYGIQDDKIMQSLVQPCMRSINLTSSTITDGSLKIISQCKHMDKIMMNRGRYQMTKKGLINLFPHLRHLRILYIADYKEFDDEVLNCLVNYCTDMAELDISGSSVSDLGMKSLSDLSKLSSLSLSKTNVTDDGVIELTKGNCRKTLTELRLCSLPITETALKAIVNNCFSLSTLICNDCKIQDMATINIDKLPMKQLSWTLSFDKPIY